MHARNGWLAHCLLIGLFVAFTVIPAMAQEEKKKEEPIPLPPVTVTAPVLPTGRPLPPEYKDHPTSVTVIPREEIERSGATTLSEVLKRVPGLNSLPGDARGFFPGLGSRGTFPFGAQSVKILVDGAPKPSANRPHTAGGSAP